MPLVLYNWLAIQPDKSVDIDQLALDLSQLPYPHAERIQVLILDYSENNGGQGAVPFNGMMLTKDNGVRYDLSNFPKLLIKVLAYYIEMAKKLIA